MSKKLIWGMLIAVGTGMSQTPAGEPEVITLEQAIQEALAKNLDLAAQKYSVSIAEARQITARLRPNPVLTISGQTLNLIGARYTPASPAGPNQFNFHTDFPMERGRKREERQALAQQDRTLAELAVRELMRQVIFAVQSAFVDVQQAKQALVLAQDNLKSLEGVVSINEARLKSGDLAKVELDRSQVAALQFRAAVQQAQLQLDQAKTQLQYLIGRRQPSPNFDITGGLRRDAVVDPQPEIRRLALNRRPDYLLTQQTQARSQADIRLQIANGKIDYSVGTEYTHQHAYGYGGSSLGFYVSAPLAVFNRNQGEIARAQRESTQAGARLQALDASIAAEVERAYRQYTVSRQLLASVETDLLIKARSVRDTTEYSYRRGEASLIEFLDAQRAFNEAMQTFNQAQTNYARSLYLIDSVSGATISGS